MSSHPGTFHKIIFLLDVIWAYGLFKKDIFSTELVIPSPWVASQGVTFLCSVYLCKLLYFSLCFIEQLVRL